MFEPQLGQIFTHFLQLFKISFVSFFFKFMFSKKATKIDEIFTVDLTLCSKCQIDGEDFVDFCGLLRKHELLRDQSVECDFPIWHREILSLVRSIIYQNLESQNVANFFENLNYKKKIAFRESVICNGIDFESFLSSQCIIFNFWMQLYNVFGPIIMISKLPPNPS